MFPKSNTKYKFTIVRRPLKKLYTETLARPAVWHTKMLIKIQNEINLI